MPRPFDHGRWSAFFTRGQNHVKACESLLPNQANRNKPPPAASCPSCKNERSFCDALTLLRPVLRRCGPPSGQEPFTTPPKLSLRKAAKCWYPEGLRKRGAKVGQVNPVGDVGPEVPCGRASMTPRGTDLLHRRTVKRQVPESKNKHLARPLPSAGTLQN